MGPFDLLSPEPPGRFGAEPDRNAFVELHNLIAAAETPAEFGPGDRDRIGRRHGVDLGRTFLSERRDLYGRLLRDRLADGDLDGDDRHALAHVAETLALTPADTLADHRRAFGDVVTDALDDDCLSVDERLILYKLQHTLGLDPRIADGAYGVLARERLLKTVAQKLCDGVLSPDEEAEIAAVAADLSVGVPPEIAAMLDAARVRWQIRHGALPTVEVPTGVARGEVGRYRTAARWSYVNATVLEKWAGRDVIHYGRTSGLRVPDAALRGRQRTGEAVVTDRSLVLVPQRGIPEDVPFRLVAQTLRFRNGTVVRTEGGKRLFVDVGESHETFYAVLYRSIEDA